MDHREQSPLLESQLHSDPDIYSQTDVTTNRKRKWRSTFVLGIILIVFKASQELSLLTLKQYVYYWCENNPTHANGDDVTNNVTESNQSACGKHETSAQKAATQWQLYFDLVYAVFGFFSLSIYGTLSDHFGRKPFLLSSMFGWIIRNAIFSAITYFDLHIAWVFLGYSLDALCGSIYGVSMMAYSSTADVTRESHERVFGMAIVEMLLGVGILTTEFSSGFYISKYGYSYPLLTAAGLATASLIIAAVLFKETINVKERHANVSKEYFESENARSFPSKLCRSYGSFYVSDGTLTDRKAFWLCLFVFCLTEFAITGYSEPMTLYQLGSPFCFTSEQIGLYSAVKTLWTMLAACLVLKLLQICLSDPVISCLGLLSGGVYCVVTGMATTALSLFVAISFGLLMYLPKSILRGTASSRASTHLQGAMFAGLTSSEMLVKVVSGPVSMSIYSATLTTGRGLVFLIIGGVYGAAFFFMMYLVHVLKRQSVTRNVLAINQQTERTAGE